MEATDRHKLPLLMPAQAQKHVTHNEALTVIDGVMHPAFASTGDAAPPADPELGSIHLVGDAATGAWFGQEGNLAIATAAGWLFAAPVEGMTALVAPTGRLTVYSGGEWQAVENLLDLSGVPELGIGAETTDFYRFAARTQGALVTALETSAGGTGDVRLVLNREASANSASVIFQDAWSGRSEFGLIDGDTFCLKVSADGSAWTDALLADSAGAVTVPGPFTAGWLALAGGATVWTSDNDGAGSGLDADLWQGLPTGALTGAQTSAGIADWSASENTQPGFSNRLMLGSDTNGPGSAGYFHSWTIHYGVSGNITQFAIPYGISNSVQAGLHVRGRYVGVWSAWMKIWTSGNDGSGSGLTADKVTAYPSGSLPSPSARGEGALILVTGLPEVRCWPIRTEPPGADRRMHRRSENGRSSAAMRQPRSKDAGLAG